MDTIILRGLEAVLVAVVARALPVPAPGRDWLHVEGLPPAALRETRIRVRAALQSVGIFLEGKALEVRIDPPVASGTGALDATIALVIAEALGRIPAVSTLVLGELAFDGALRPVRGVLPTLLAATARGYTEAVIPATNAREGAEAGGLRVLTAEHLRDLLAAFSGGAALPWAPAPVPFVPSTAARVDLSTISAPPHAFRALEIAAAGGHGLLVIGENGTRQADVANELVGILPPLTREEAVEVTSLFSVSGLVALGGGLLTARPARAPHHTVSDGGLLGGGQPVRPGEVSLAHHGVLVLHELHEFRGSALDGIDRVLTAGESKILLAKECHAFPARSQIVATMPFCYCGCRACTCTPEGRARFRSHYTKAMARRLDVAAVLSVDEPRVYGEPSDYVRLRVTNARAFGARRGAGVLNAALTQLQVESACEISLATVAELKPTIDSLSFSSARWTTTLRVARTIADLAGSERVTAAHIAEAFTFTIPLPEGVR